MFLNWPGEYFTQTDHRLNSPFFCIKNWKKETSAPAKETKFFTLFAVKERYHKLFTPGAQLKFYCSPDEQIHCDNLDSSVLFSKRKTKEALRYKNSFLTNASTDSPKNNCTTEFQDIGNSSDVSDYASEANSKDTIIYDELSYKNSVKNYSDDSDDFLADINNMHHKIKTDHADALKKLMTSPLSDIIDDPALNVELKNCREDGNWQKRVITPQQFSVRNNPFVVSNEVRRNELQSAYKNVESLRIDTVLKLNKHYNVMTKL